MTHIDPWATLLQPLAWHETVHMLLAAFAASGFLVGGIHAWCLLRNRENLFHHRALLIALAVGSAAALIQPLSGDLIARTVAVHQPAKLAAMEALFTTTAGADFLLGGIPDATTRTVPYALVIPNGLSLLLHGALDARVVGLDSVPEGDWPPVAVVHVAFQLMVGCGFVLAGLAIWIVWRWWMTGGLEEDTWLLRSLVLAAPLGFVALESGWVVTEVGRQPWIIHNVMRTSEAVTPMPGLWVPLTTFSLLYAILGAIVVWALWRHIAATQPDG